MQGSDIAWWALEERDVIFPVVMDRIRVRGIHGEDDPGEVVPLKERPDWMVESCSCKPCRYEAQQRLMTPYAWTRWDNFPNQDSITPYWLNRTKPGVGTSFWWIVPCLLCPNMVVTCRISDPRGWRETQADGVKRPAYEELYSVCCRQCSPDLNLPLLSSKAEYTSYRCSGCKAWVGFDEETSLLYKGAHRKARKAQMCSECYAVMAPKRVPFTREDVAHVMAKWRADGKRCHYCRRTFGQWRGFMHVDHVMPVSKGGTNVWTNLVPACKECNISKRDKNVQEWMAEKGLLTA